MQFDTFIAQAWDDHVRDPQGVADRLADARPLRDNGFKVELAVRTITAVLGELMGENS